MKIVKLIFLFLLSCVRIFAQTPEENHDKYWYYRHRLINNFMLVGEGQGYSLPAFRRVNTAADPQTLDWGDGQDPGWYIGILATEYALLKKNNQDASETLKELYYALEAINRLDFNLELDWGAASGSYNGSYIRDDIIDYRTDGNLVDISEDFVHNNYEHFNFPTVQTQLPPVIKGKSIYGAHHRDDGCCTEENSQDNVIHLMIGLSLINKFFDGSAVYNDGSGAKPFNRDGETSILQEARNICNDAVNWIKEGKNTSYPTDMPWALFNPVTGNLVQEGNGLFDSKTNQPQCYGCISYGMAEAACKATDKNNLPHFATGFTCSDYHNLLSYAQQYTWNVLQDPVNLALTNFGPGTDHLIGILAAIGNSWYLTQSPPFVVNTTGDILALFYYNFLKRQDREYLPLLRQVLHGGINLVPDHVYTDLLNSAPCLGPWNFAGNDYGNGSMPNYEWSTSNRFRNPENRGSATAGDEPGEYWGGDYMLLFNLYCLAQDDYLDHYFNKMDQIITQDFPHGAFFEGSTVVPKEIDAFNSITAYNHIKSGGTVFTDGDVTYHAGREIALLPGFGVDAGAEFGAFIQPFQCNGSNYVRSTTDTSKQKPTVYNQPTNYVYYADAGKNSTHPSVSTSSLLTTPPSHSKTQDLKLTQEINITPNPSGGLFTVQLKESTTGEIFIYNELGQEIYKTAVGNGQLAIDLSSQAKGIYFLKLISEKGTETKKVVIQ